MNQKYLYIPALPNGLNILQKVCDEFLKKASFTSNELIIVMENKSDIYKYIGKWVYGQGIAKIHHVIKKDVDLIKLFEEVDNYIISDNIEEEKYIEYAFYRKVNLIPETTNEVFKNISINQEAIDTKSNIQLFVEQALYNVYPKEKYVYILHNQGIGETMAFFFWINILKKKLRKKILLIELSNIFREIFSKAKGVDVIVTVPPIVYQYLHVYDEDIYCNMNHVHFSKFSADYVYENTFIEEARDFIGLPSDITYDIYDVGLTKEEILEAERTFSRLNLKKGKTIFLVLGGNAFPITFFVKNFWIRCINYFLNQGYDVVVNSKEEIIPLVPHVFLPFWVNVHFVSLCGNIISASSGISEAMCILNRKKHINLAFVWPNSKNDFWRTNSTMTGINLKRMKQYGEGFVDDFIEFQMRFLRKMFGNNINVINVLNGNTEDEDMLIIKKIYGTFLNTEIINE